MLMVLFGLACLLVYALSAWAESSEPSKYTDAVGVSSLLCVSYGMSNALVEMYGFPEAVLAFPVIDAALAWMVWRAWQKKQAHWKAGVLLLLVAQLTMHVAMVTAWELGTASQLGMYRYSLLINLTFAGQLAIVAGSSLSHAVDHTLNHLLGHWRQARNEAVK